MTTPEAFAITCVTCGSRLKVGSRAFIGSIESCPKCGAMVQITAPDEESFGLSSADASEQVAVGPLGEVDSDAITQSAVAEMDAGVSGGNKTALPLPPSDSSIVTPPPVSRSEEAVSSATRSNATQFDEATEYRHEIEGAWQSESTKRTKQLVLVALMSIFGLIAATVVFSQFLRTWRDKKGHDQQVVTGETQVEPENAPAANINVDTPSSDPGDTELPVTPPKLVPNDSTQVLPEVVDVDVPPPTEVPGDNKAAENTAADSKASDNEIVDDAAPSQMKNLPPGLEKFVPLLSLETTENQTATPLQAPPTINAVRIDEAAIDEAADGVVPQRKPIEVEKSLALRFAIDSKSVSLAELTLLISQLTTVPIEIELISLDAAGFRVELPIKTPNKLISSREWIDGVCKSLGMVSQTRDDRLMISASNESVDAGMSAALLLDDFGDESQDIFEWILPLLLDREPAVDPANLVEGVDVQLPSRLSDDGQSIVPGDNLRSKVQAMLAIEAVRLMRGMPPKLERWRTSRWMGAWPANSVASDASTFGDWPIVSDGKHGPLLDSPRAVADLLHFLGKQNQAEVLVGWYDATRRGLYPADSLMPYTEKQTAAAMLDEIIGEQELQARVCGPSLWYICSESSYDRFEVIAWFEIPPGSENEIRQRLANSLNLVATTTMPVAFEGNRMLIRCPRYLARQMQRIITP